MTTFFLVIVAILSNYLINELSDRSEFPAPLWVIWIALIGLGLLFDLKDKLPKQLEAVFRNNTPEALGQWTYSGILIVAVCGILAVRVWPQRQQSNLANNSRPSTANNAREEKDPRQQLLQEVEQYIAIRRQQSLHNEQVIDVRMKDVPQALGKQPHPNLAPVIQPESSHSSRLKPLDTQPGWLQIRRKLSLNLASLFGRESSDEDDKANLDQELSPETSIISAFQREEIHGRLLILGEPGAGKTTYLLELAWDLIEQAKQNPAAPVPVIVDLASWQADQSIPKWLQAQLPKPFANLDSQTISEWLSTETLVLLLDGLDELGMELQTECTKALKLWLSQISITQPVVVCCRKEEFEKMWEATGLDLTELMGGAVTLLALEDNQIQTYLTKLGRYFLWEQAICSNPDLHQLARRPFFLTLMVEAYGEGDQQRAIKTETELLERYVQQKLKQLSSTKARNSNSSLTGYQPPNEDKTRYWLSWLAKQVKQNDQLFYIELMQPHTLLTENHEKWSYQLIVGLIVGLIFGLIFGSTGGLIIGLIFGLIGGLIFGSTGGLMFLLLGRLEPITLIESFNIVPSRFIQRSFLQKLMFWLLGGLLGGLFLALTIGLIVGLIVGLILGLIFGLIQTLKQDITFRKYPNQGIIASRNNVLRLLPLLSLATTLMWWLLDIFAITKQLPKTELLITGVGLGILLSFLFGGGIGVIQHYTLRWVLASGKNPVMPWHYADFLSYASEHRILQQVGGGYRFIHDKLRAHLADHPTPINNEKLPPFTNTNKVMQKNSSP